MTLDVAQSARVQDLAMQLCRTLSLDPAYVFRLDVGIDDVTAHLYRGRDGRCQGPKYIDPTGDAATEIVTFTRADRDAALRATPRAT